MSWNNIQWWVLYRSGGQDAPEIMRLMADTTLHGKRCAYCPPGWFASCPGFERHVADQRAEAEGAAGETLHLVTVEIAEYAPWDLAMKTAKALIMYGKATPVEQTER